ncbi:hypothetical protein SIN01_24680 [Sporolactobacillus inulinus]|nr:hypothetical protein SIN01_24680 [Sporolactobacillus inulinus]
MVATAMDGLVFGEPQDAAFYRTTYTRFLKPFIFNTFFLTRAKKAKGELKSLLPWLHRDSKAP